MWKPRKFQKIMRRIKPLGVTGFAGQCAILAFCVQKHLYPDAEVVGAFNQYLWEKGIPYGHVFLFKDGVYFDARNVSTDIHRFIPLVQLDPSNDLFGEMPRTQQELIEKMNAAIVVRNLRQSNIPKLATQYDWVCRTFVNALI